MTTANILSQLGSPGVSTGFKNRIINGAMVIDQRNAGASVTPANGAATFTVDRFSCFVNQASKLTAQQSSTAPTGFVNSLKITSSSAYSLGATDAFLLQQPIEGYNVADLNWGTANAKTVTLSFQVYSSLTGTFGGSLLNSTQNRSHPFTYSIPVANTWTTISVTIAGDTTGTWGTTNGIGILVVFGLGIGSTYSGTAGSWAGATYYSVTGATSVVGTNGATFYITGVQLEVGTTATNFDYRSYGTELALCQRYCYGQNNVAGQAYYWFGIGCSASSSAAFGTTQFPVTMRAKPSVTISAPTSFYMDPGANNFTAVGADQIGVNGGAVYFTGGSGYSAGYASRWLSNNTAAAYVIWSAEL